MEIDVFQLHGENDPCGRTLIDESGRKRGASPGAQHGAHGRRFKSCTQGCSAEFYDSCYVHHTDAKREWAYDRESHIGKLDAGLDQAKADGWTVVDMGKDWNVIFSFEVN